MSSNILSPFTSFPAALRSLRLVVLVLFLGCYSAVGVCENAHEELDLGYHPQTWHQFETKVHLQDEKNRADGWAYIVSGALVGIGSTIGMNKSTDIFAQSAYSISQSLSIAAIGYGAYLYNIGDDEKAFFQIIQNSKNLSDEAKNSIYQSYEEQTELRRKKARWIRVITHSLIAASNFNNALNESDPALRTTLFFLGGVNVVAAISF